MNRRQRKTKLTPSVDTCRNTVCYVCLLFLCFWFFVRKFSAKSEKKLNVFAECRSPTSHVELSYKSYNPKIAVNR